MFLDRGLLLAHLLVTAQDPGSMRGRSQHVVADHLTIHQLACRPYASGPRDPISGKLRAHFLLGICGRGSARNSRTPNDPIGHFPSPSGVQPKHILEKSYPYVGVHV